MEQSEAAEATAMVTTASDFSQGKPARQLDFTAMCRATANMILPEHPQAQLQSKLLALAQPQAPPPLSQAHAVPHLGRQPRPKPLVPLAPRVAHPMRPQPRPTLPPVVFQEVVPLNAGNVLGAKTRRPIRKWESIIPKTLNRSSEPETKHKSYSAPPSPVLRTSADILADNIDDPVFDILDEGIIGAPSVSTGKKL